jgi:arylsulfatase A-like enzyme
MTPTRRSLLIASLSVLVASCAASVARAAGAGTRPNILFIMSDDHAAHAIGCYGSKVNETPFLDRIAKEGMRLDRCFATNSICTPSRATILTGKYSHLNGVPVFNRFDGSQQTVAKLLQQAGYYTGMIGKWHLFSDPTGFDYWTVLPGQGRYVDPVFIDANGRHVIKGYASDVITDVALQFLDKRPADKPFFLMLHHKAPHRPWDPDDKHKAMFAGKKIPEPSTLRDTYESRTDAIRNCKQKVFTDLTNRDLKVPPPPGLSKQQQEAWNETKPTSVTVDENGNYALGGSRTLTGEEFHAWEYQRYMQDYLACIQSVDDNVGRVLDYLDKHDLANNTVVVYTSDQGFFLGDHGLYDKRFMYEPSLKMPFVIRWPAVIKPASTSDALATNADFAETFLEIAGAPIPPDMQGHSLVPVLKGEKPSDWRTSFYYRYYHDPGHHNTAAHYGVRTDTHKLIYFWRLNQWELYDLKSDPDEMHNLYNDPAQQDLVKRLKEELYRLKKEVKDDDQFANSQPKNEG